MNHRLFILGEKKREDHPPMFFERLSKTCHVATGAKIPKTTRE